MKNLAEINRDFIRKQKRSPPNNNGDRKFILALTAIVVLVAGLILLLRILGAVTWFRVASASMQRELPEGSLVIVRHINPEKIQVGDTITYRWLDGSTVTHKVIEIVSRDGLYFLTQGVENRNSDPLVPKDSVVGKVVFHITGAGEVIDSLSGLLPPVLLSAFVITSLIIRLRENRNTTERKIGYDRTRIHK